MNFGAHVATPATSCTSKPARPNESTPMTIQLPEITTPSTRDVLIASISAILIDAIESGEVVPLVEVASRIASSIEPTTDDVDRLHRRVRKAIGRALNEAGLMDPHKFREEYYDGFEWPDDLAFVVSTEVVRHPAEWRDERDEDRRMNAARDLAWSLGKLCAVLPPRTLRLSRRRQNLRWASQPAPKVCELNH